MKCFSIIWLPTLLEIPSCGVFQHQLHSKMCTVVQAVSKCTSFIYYSELREWNGCPISVLFFGGKLSSFKPRSQRKVGIVVHKEVWCTAGLMYPGAVCVISSEGVTKVVRQLQGLYVPRVSGASDNYVCFSVGRVSLVRHSATLPGGAATTRILTPTLLVPLREVPGPTLNPCLPFPPTRFPLTSHTYYSRTSNFLTF